MTTTSDTYDSAIYGLRNKAGLEWWDDATCRITDHGLDFFDGKITNVNRLKKLCSSCPVQAKCLSFAVVNDVSDGVFGGLTRAERVAL